MSHDSEVDFSGLILGFSSAALSYLGYGETNKNPEPKTLVLAKQNIDILILLREKTRGNLLSEESNLINSVVSDLMVKYTDAHKKLFSAGS